MSGGAFEYKEFWIEEISEEIQSEIDNSGKEIPLEDRDNDEDWYEKYPEDKYYREHSDEVLNELKDAVEALKRAYVYAKRIDMYLSDDDGEGTFLAQLKLDLNKL